MTEGAALAAASKVTESPSISDTQAQLLAGVREMQASLSVAAQKLLHEDTDPRRLMIYGGHVLVFFGATVTSASFLLRLTFYRAQIDEFLSVLGLGTFLMLVGVGIYVYHYREERHYSTMILRETQDINKEIFNTVAPTHKNGVNEPPK
jgi:hypothetical protein